MFFRERNAAGNVVVTALNIRRQRNMSPARVTRGCLGSGCEQWESIQFLWRRDAH